MKTHAPALARKSAAPVAATPAPSSMFRPRPFAKPEETEEESPALQNGNLEKVLQAKPINIPLYSPNPVVQRQPAIEEDEVRRQPDEEEEDLPVQAKLTIGEPGDRYEQEADCVASEVVSQINAPQSSPIQREETEEKDELQTKALAGAITPLQREAMPEEEADLKRSPVQRREEAGGVNTSPNLEQSISQARGGGKPLDPSVREPLEQTMGADFSGVKVHTDAQADQLNRSFQARAFTTGQDVFFRQGEYNPGSRGGQELIAHELTHVVQQSGEVHRLQHPIAPSLATTPTTIQLKWEHQGSDGVWLWSGRRDPTEADLLQIQNAHWRREELIYDDRAGVAPRTGSGGFYQRGGDNRMVTMNGVTISQHGTPFAPEYAALPTVW